MILLQIPAEKEKGLINAELESPAADPFENSVSVEIRGPGSLLPLPFQAGIYFFPLLFLQSETPSRTRN
jgi:hypothetical protein